MIPFWKDKKIPIMTIGILFLCLKGDLYKVLDIHGSLVIHDDFVCTEHTRIAMGPEGVIALLGYGLCVHVARFGGICMYVPVFPYGHLHEGEVLFVDRNLDKRRM